MNKFSCILCKIIYAGGWFNHTVSVNRVTLVKGLNHASISVN